MADMNGTFQSGDLTLTRYLVRPPGRHVNLPAVILCHGFPIGPLDARQSATTFPNSLIASPTIWVGRQ